MRKQLTLLAALSMAIGGVAITGCDTEDDAYVAPQTPQYQTTPAPSDRGTDKAREGMRDTGEGIKQGAQDAGETLKQGAQKTGEAVREGAQDARDAADKGLQKSEEQIKKDRELLDQKRKDSNQSSPQQPPQD